MNKLNLLKTFSKLVLNSGARNLSVCQRITKRIILICDINIIMVQIDA